jgi:hypothetical protein
MINSKRLKDVKQQGLIDEQDQRSQIACQAPSKARVKQKRSDLAPSQSPSCELYHGGTFKSHTFSATLKQLESIGATKVALLDLR